jgi:hypothetical protein
MKVRNHRIMQCDVYFTREIFMEYEEPPTDWEIADTHEVTGRKVYQHTTGFRHTGNNEGEFTEEIKVEERGGAIILETSMFVEWEYHGHVRVTFSASGDAITLTSSDGQRETCPLPSPDKHPKAT